MATPPTLSSPPTSAPSTSVGGVTLDTIMAQLQRMDARLNTLFTKLYQLNTCVGRIARWQAHLDGFVESLSPPSKTSEDDDDDEDGDASSSSSDKMST